MNPGIDTELVIAVQNGDITAYEELVRRYQKRLIYFANRIVRNEPAAEDIVQEAFIKVYRHIDVVDTTRKFSTYIFEITKNASLSYLRRQHKQCSLEDLEEITSDISFVDEYLREETAEEVRKSLSLLPNKYRRVLTLYYFQELSYEQISKHLHIPLNTVRTYLRRAKARLIRILPYENT